MSMNSKTNYVQEETVLRDCGQRGVCRTPPGCMRHWEERNRELVRLATMAGVVPANVHEHGWQWRPTDADTAFAPPFGTIRQCRVCGCLVAGGPTACARCAEAGA